MLFLGLSFFIYKMDGSITLIVVRTKLSNLCNVPAKACRRLSDRGEGSRRGLVVVEDVPAECVSTPQDLEVGVENKGTSAIWAWLSG